MNQLDTLEGAEWETVSVVQNWTLNLLQTPTKIDWNSSSTSSAALDAFDAESKWKTWHLERSLSQFEHLRSCGEEWRKREMCSIRIMNGKYLSISIIYSLHLSWHFMKASTMKCEGGEWEFYLCLNNSNCMVFLFENYISRQFFRKEENSFEEIYICLSSKHLFSDLYQIHDRSDRGFRGESR